MNAQIKPFAVLSEIHQVPYWEVESYWPKYASMIQRAIEVQDEWTLQDVYKELITSAYSQRPMQLWVIPNQFALVTQIQVFPTGVRKCLLFLAGGENLPAINAAQGAVMEWAKKYHGCQKFIIYGRRGFLRALDGFKEVSTIMERKL